MLGQQRQRSMFCSLNSACVRKLNKMSGSEGTGFIVLNIFKQTYFGENDFKINGSLLLSNYFEIKNKLPN
jgi:hypothetical protein